MDILGRFIKSQYSLTKSNKSPWWMRRAFSGDLFLLGGVQAPPNKP